MTRSHRGHTLTEMLIVLAIMAVMGAMVVPRLSYGLVRKKKAETTAYKLMTDLRLTRSLAIRDAATNPVGYELDLTGTSPYSGYKILNSFGHVEIATHAFESGVTVICPAGPFFKYSPLGNLISAQSGNQILVSGDGTTYTLTLDAVSATGSVKCTKN